MTKISERTKLVIQTAATIYAAELVIRKNEEIKIFEVMDEAVEDAVLLVDRVLEMTDGE